MSSDRQAPVHWTDERVEQLLLRVFGEAPVPPSPPGPRPRWSHWPLVATCAALLLALAPALRAPSDNAVAEHADEPREELVVADASDSEEGISLDASSESSDEESSDSDSESEDSEASSS